ncbi:MAG: molybdopterin-dependent oxidoreductase, partial [Vicinamibacterales bacterium]|nr:molybdopterin-dependent oxidoreductase [Vicinamibacterales bacterium]
PTGRQGYPTDLNAYLHIGANGRVTCLVGKIEMGQGAQTSLPQLVAEELDVPLSSVDIVMGDTDLCPWDMGTFGSLSIRQFGPILRAAAAEARAVLLQLAAERLQVPVTDLRVDAGVVVHAKDASQRVSYGDLTAGRKIERKLEGKPALESVKTFTIVGTSAPRRDALEKVTGKAKFAGDIVPPGALHARVLRPPAHGATLVSVDTSAAEARPGVKVVREGDLVAALHEHRDEADAALALIKAQFGPSPSTLDETTIFEHLAKAAPAGDTVAEGGTLVEGARLAMRTFEQTYLNSYVAHAPMETHSAVAAFEDGKLTVWASTQTPFPLKSQLAQALKLPPEKVRVITPYVGGGFGGKSASRQGIEAARLAAIVGRPVRVVWSREEEFHFDTFRPAAVITVKSGLDAAGKVVSWDYQVIGAGERGAAHFYDIPHHRTVARGGWNANTPGLHPFAIGPWRAPAANSNAFARELHMDLMASAAGIDPVEFRLRNLADARMTRVLNAAAKQFGWTPKAAPSRRGFGVACGTDAGTYVASMAEVRVDQATGRVQVVRVVCAQDMGVLVNPEGARQQMEGCITMGLGYALSEEVRFRNGEVLDRNFDSYELPRFSWLPTIESVILDSPDLPAQGGGEPAIVTMGAVVANAIFDACGARVLQLPMTPARVKAALKP